MVMVSQLAHSNWARINSGPGPLFLLVVISEIPELSAWPVGAISAYLGLDRTELREDSSLDSYNTPVDDTRSPELPSFRCSHLLFLGVEGASHSPCSLALITPTIGCNEY